MNKKLFYDPHLHLVNLSHAGLLAYLNRFLGKKKLTYRALLNKNLISLIFQFISSTVDDDDSTDITCHLKLLSFIKILFYIGLPLGAYFIVHTIIFSYFKSIAICNTIKDFLDVFLTISLPILTLITVVEIILIAIYFKKLFTFIKIKLGLSNGEKPINKVINLISMLENDIGSSLLLIELDILGLDEKFCKSLDEESLNLSEIYKRDSTVKSENGSLREKIEIVWKEHNKDIKGFKIGNLLKENEKYEKYILTPLIVDFGYNRFEVGDVYYHNPPNKPVVSQTKDVFLGIQNYRKNSPFGIFEIYPFMGLNPEHYDLYIKLDNNKPVKGHNSIELMFDKYFSLFDKDTIGQARYKKFEDALPTYTDNLDKEVDEIIAKEVRKRLENKAVQKEIDSDNININEITKVLNEIKDKPELGFNKSADEIRNKFYNYFFIGIKVYPPLGFDPAPWVKKELNKTYNVDYNNLDLSNIKPNLSKIFTDDLEIKDREYFKKKTTEIIQRLRTNINFSINDEVEKQIYIYLYCEEKSIPIVTHCNNGGFLSETEENTTLYTNPERWEWVLRLFPDLKINFAHLGGGSFKVGKSKKEKERAKEAFNWRTKVYELITTYKNAYTDFSCMCFDEKDYKKFYIELNKYIRHPKKEIKYDIYDKILFGTDFSVNIMFGAKSYQEYIKNFTIQKSFNKKHIALFCEKNPEKFLFGKINNV